MNFEKFVPDISFFDIQNLLNIHKSRNIQSKIIFKELVEITRQIIFNTLSLEDYNKLGEEQQKKIHIVGDRIYKQYTGKFFQAVKKEKINNDQKFDLCWVAFGGNEIIAIGKKPLEEKNVNQLEEIHNVPIFVYGCAWHCK